MKINDKFKDILEDLTNVEFSNQINGYNAKQVDGYIDNLYQQIAFLSSQVTDLELRHFRLSEEFKIKEKDLLTCQSQLRFFQEMDK